MGRTLRTGIDQLAGYFQLGYFPNQPVEPPEADYYELGFALDESASAQYDVVTIWGTGLISFGPATDAQKAFMANLSSTSDLSLFPGDFIAAGFSSAQSDPITVLRGNPSSSDLKIWWDDGVVTINAEGIDFSGNPSGGFQTGYNLDGSGFVPGSQFVYWSDLDVITGTDAGETLQGTTFAETLRGLGGNDTLIGGLGADALDGGSGNDTLLGGAGLDRLWGGDGNDILNPGTDFRLVDGGAGFDRLILNYGGSTDSLVTSVAAILADPRVSGIEAVDLTGTNFVDVLSGSAGDDRLFGGGSYDVLNGGAGNDWLDAGAPGASAVGRIPGGGPSPLQPMSLDYLFTAGAAGPTLSTTVTYVPVLLPDVPQGYFMFTVTEPGTRMWIDWNFQDAASNGNFFWAVTDVNGNELIKASGFASAEPYVFTEPGTYFFSVDLFSGSSWEYGYLNLDITLENAEILTSNRLIGGMGNDTYVIYSPTDQVIEEAGGGTDTVRSGISTVLSANVERLVLTGSSAVNGSGNELANQLTGNNAANALNGGLGDDLLFGSGGNDRLTGNDGSDRLTGGAGGDRFVFTAEELGTTTWGEHDTITDFQRRLDKIDLSWLYAGSTFGGLKFGKASDATTISDHRALFYYDGNRTFLIGDTDGVAGADFAIELTGRVQLKESDLITGTTIVYAAGSDMVEWGREMFPLVTMPEAKADLFWA